MLYVRPPKKRKQQLRVATPQSGLKPRNSAASPQNTLRHAPRTRPIQGNLNEQGIPQGPTINVRSPQNTINPQSRGAATPIEKEQKKRKNFLLNIARRMR